MDGHIQVRRGLMNHIRAGKLSAEELGVYVHLLFCADFKTGLQLNSAPHIFYSMGQRDDIRTIQRVLEHLEKLTFIKRFVKRGRKGDYPIIVDKYEITDGVLKGSRLDASSTKDWQDIQYVSGTDGRTETRTETRITSASLQASSEKKLAKNSEKNSEKKSKKSENKLEKAKAEASASSSRSLTEKESQVIEYILNCIRPEDEDSRQKNLKLLTGFPVDNPVLFANQLVWAYTISNYSSNLNGVRSFLSVYENVEKSYEKYNATLRFGKLPHHKCLLNLEQVLGYAEYWRSKGNSAQKPWEYVKTNFGPSVYKEFMEGGIPPLSEPEEYEFLTEEEWEGLYGNTPVKKIGEEVDFGETPIPPQHAPATVCSHGVPKTHFCDTCVDENPL